MRLSNSGLPLGRHQAIDLKNAGKQRERLPRERFVSGFQIGRARGCVVFARQRASTGSREHAGRSRPEPRASLGFAQAPARPRKPDRGCLWRSRYYRLERARRSTGGHAASRNERSFPDRTAPQQPIRPWRRRHPRSPFVSTSEHCERGSRRRRPGSTTRGKAAITARCRRRWHYSSASSPSSSLSSSSVSTSSLSRYSRRTSLRDRFGFCSTRNNHQPFIRSPVSALAAANGVG